MVPDCPVGPASSRGSLEWQWGRGVNRSERWSRWDKAGRSESGRTSLPLEGSVLKKRLVISYRFSDSQGPACVDNFCI